MTASFRPSPPSPKPSSAKPSSARPSSPCIQLCALDAVTGLCEGCGRTRDEIGRWGGLSEPQRLAIMAGLQERLRRAYPARFEKTLP